MVLVSRLSPTQLRVDGRTFSQIDFDIAQKFIQRKSAGQRGTLVRPTGEFSKPAQLLVDLLGQDPKVREALERGTRIGLGIGSLEEERAIIKRRLTPTRQLTPQQQLLAITEGRGLTPTQLRLQKELLQFPRELALPDLPMTIRRDLSKQPLFIQRILVGDIGEKIIPAPRLLPQLFPLQKTKLTAKEFKTRLEKFGLPASVVAEFIPTTPLDIAVIGATLPLLAGIGGKVAQQLTIGVISGIGAFTAIDEDLPLKTRIAGGLLAIAPLLTRLRIPKGKKGESRFALLTEELEGKLVKKKKKVFDIDIIAEELKRKREGKIIRDKTNAEKIEDIRKIFKEISKTKDPLLRQQQLIEATELFKLAHGKTQAKSLLKDFIQQEGLILQKQLPVVSKKIPVTQLARISEDVLTPTKLKEIQRITNAKTKQQERIEFSQKSLGERYTEAQKLSPEEKQKLRQQIAVIQKRTQATRQLISQAILQRQRQLQQQRLKNATKLIQLLQPQLTFAQAQSLARKQLVRKGLFPKIIPVPKLKLKPVKKKIKVKKKLPFPISKQGYNVFGKPIKQKKFRRLNKVPLTKAKAKDLGAWLTDHSLARTFKLKQTNKEAQKPKLKVPASYFSKTKHKFRDFRKVKGEKIPLKNKWIEKKGKFLLDTRAERNKITLLAKLSKLKKKVYFSINSYPRI